MIFIFTIVTLIAFAANSLLCRMALGENLIDPVSFTSIRLVSGAASLIIISRFAGEERSSNHLKGSWISGVALFSYAITFSIAYLWLSAGMGALILFGSVQLTMIGTALTSGENLGSWQWGGLAAAMSGLVFLVSPGITAPSPIGFSLMCISGISWGVYSICGKGVSSPITMTSINFTRSAPMAIFTSVIAVFAIQVQTAGAILALISGAVTSGLGYALWYRTLRDLTTTQASVVQLTVPVIAAFGGVIFLSEQVSLRLITASLLILGGVAMAILKRG